jgi:hypothetical protein
MKHLLRAWRRALRAIGVKPAPLAAWHLLPREDGGGDLEILSFQILALNERVNMAFDESGDKLSAACGRQAVGR